MSQGAAKKEEIAHAGFVNDHYSTKMLAAMCLNFLIRVLFFHAPF